MADVSRDDRGQLMLIAAISIAALLVLVAVLLSSVVYTENVATRGGHGDDARTAQLHRVAAVDAVEGILDRSNRDGASYEAFRANVTVWDRQQARHAATSGANARVSVRSMTNGTRIVQTNATRTLTNASGNASWELVTGADSLRWWTVTVAEASLATADSTTANATVLHESGAFHTTVTAGTETRELFLYSDNGSVVAHVDPGNGTLLAPCTASPDANGTVTVDVSMRTVGSNDCPALASLDESPGPFDVDYHDGENATGTYSLVVERHVDDVADGDFAAGEASPSALPHVSDVRLDVTYDTADVRYRVWNVTVPQEGSP